MTAAPKKRLGRGLAALIGDDEALPGQPETIGSTQDGLTTLPIESIRSNKLNPRKLFSDDELDELASSIRKKGILQPVVVRPTAISGNYEIVAGERRWRAAQRAALHDIPVLIRDFSDQEVMEVALIENVQRTDLNPVEESLGYQQLIDQYGYTQQQLADVIGKSRSHIANTLRLSTLPEVVLQFLRTGRLTAGHARALIATSDPEKFARKIVEEGLSVRQAEELGRSSGKSSQKKSSSSPQDSNIAELEKQLREALGLKVDIRASTDQSGVLRVKYANLDQLESLCLKLGVSV